MPNQKKILVIAPHCDDEVLTCGASIVKWTAAGHSVLVEALTANGQAYSGKRDYQKLCREVMGQLHDASAELGCKSNLDAGPHLHSNTGSDMYISPNGDTILRCMDIIRRYNPDIVVTTHPNDFHTDHRNTALAVREAAYQASRRGISGSTEEMKEPTVLWGEVDMEGVTNMRVDVFSEVTEEQLEKKLAALKAYEGFVDAHPEQSKSIFGTDHAKDWVFTFARVRGMHAGVKYAEVFEVANYKPQFSVEALGV